MIWKSVARHDLSKIFITHTAAAGKVVVILEESAMLHGLTNLYLNKTCDCAKSRIVISSKGKDL